MPIPGRAISTTTDINRRETRLTSKRPESPSLVLSRSVENKGGFEEKEIASEDSIGDT